MIYISFILCALAVLFMLKPQIILNALDQLEEYPVFLRFMFVALIVCLVLQLIIIFT